MGDVPFKKTSFNVTQHANTHNLTLCLPPQHPLLFLTDNLPCHFVSAFGAGFITTVIASPVDVVKTRYMNSPPGQYKSAINCSWTMMTKEGPSAFYKGWASRTHSDIDL